MKPAEPDMKREKKGFHLRRRALQLLVIDAVWILLVGIFMFLIYPSGVTRLSTAQALIQIGIMMACIFTVRLLLGIYSSVWRYGNTKLYLKLVASDFFAGCAYYLITHLFRSFGTISFIRAAAAVAVSLLISISARLFYQYIYDYNSGRSRHVRLIRALLQRLFGIKRENEQQTGMVGQQINIAIVGAGRVGVLFAEELMNNPRSAYRPVCFIDNDPQKAGQKVAGLNVYAPSAVNSRFLASWPIQEVVIAITEADIDRKRELYDYYKDMGCKIKVYDYPMAEAVEGGRRKLREFDIQELLFRSPKEFLSEETRDYYRGKAVLITGGGGSIGSEIARQVARMDPKRLILLDVYENAVYDIQQELRMKYHERLDLTVEVLTICDREQLDMAFARCRPDVVLHAAAHKHVPLMEHNCVEAVRNNVFGTLNVVDMCEKYGVHKAIMVSTDKAVNPTNVMGATKRMCEMIFLSRRDSKTSFCCTRFGNVLGSNGSVIPLFKRQIDRGGPVTITDKRIIRYFMTIPEAAQLVLTCGSMARKGELFVLDMGKPVKILDLAESMIRLSGYEPYKEINIVETGLRPGEKLYEELLIKTEELDKTDNEMIFVERDEPLSREKILEKLDILRRAAESEDDEAVRRALKKIVPTYRSAQSVNSRAEDSEEMKESNQVRTEG
ncbi:MAG: polysaccharide biosynthesis protein [Clostridia bacterium]|nr:polysaccharide biosynthesis protein [Clostridia bacterium]